MTANAIRWHKSFLYRHSSSPKRNPLLFRWLNDGAIHQFCLPTVTSREIDLFDWISRLFQGKCQLNSFQKLTNFEFLRRIRKFYKLSQRLRAFKKSRAFHKIFEKAYLKLLISFRINEKKLFWKFTDDQRKHSSNWKTNFIKLLSKSFGKLQFLWNKKQIDRPSNPTCRYISNICLLSITILPSKKFDEFSKISLWAFRQSNNYIINCRSKTTPGYHHKPLFTFYQFRTHFINLFLFFLFFTFWF